MGLPGPHAEAKACVLGCPCVSWPMRFTWTSSWDGVCRVSPPPAVRLLLRLLSRETCEAMPVSWLLVLGRGGPVTCRWMSAATMVTLAPIWQTLVLSAVQVSWRSAGRAPPPPGLLGRLFLSAARAPGLRASASLFAAPRQLWRWPLPCLLGVLCSCVPIWSTFSLVAMQASRAHSRLPCPGLGPHPEGRPPAKALPGPEPPRRHVPPGDLDSVRARGSCRRGGPSSGWACGFPSTPCE